MESNVEEVVKEQVKYGFEELKYKIESIYDQGVRKVLNDFLEALESHKNKKYGNAFKINHVGNFLISCPDKKEREKTISVLKDILYSYDIIDDNTYEVDLDMEDHLSMFLSRLKKHIKDKTFIYINNTLNLPEDDITSMDKIMKKLGLILKDSSDKAIIVLGNDKGFGKILNNYPLLGHLFKNNIEFGEYSLHYIKELLIHELKNNGFIVKLSHKPTIGTIDMIRQETNLTNHDLVDFIYSNIVINTMKKNTNIVTLKEFPKILNKYFSDEPKKQKTNAIKTLKELPGLLNVKEQVEKLSIFLEYKKLLEDMNGLSNEVPLNMFFTGNPGTGKTTIAKICADILYDLGYIEENKVEEIVPSSLMGEYVGQTQRTSREVLKKAEGGVLFIDEAYLLAEHDTKTGAFMHQAVVELLKYMEDRSHVVIFAGYKDKMEDVLTVNPGLRSRIGTYINFPDYTADELIEILLYKAKKQKIKIDKDALNKIKALVEIESIKPNFGNGRYVETLFNDLLYAKAKNYKKNNIKKNLFTIRQEDVELLIEESKKDIKTNKFGFRI